MVYADTNSETLKKKKAQSLAQGMNINSRPVWGQPVLYETLFQKHKSQAKHPSLQKISMTIKRSSSWTSARFQTAGGIKSCSRTGELNYFGDFLTASCWIPLFTNSYVTCMHLCVQGLSGSGIYLLMSKNLNSKDTPSVHALTQSSPHFSSGVYMEA